MSTSKVEVTLQLTVSQSVCLGMEDPCGTCDRILLPVCCCLKFAVLYLWGALSDERTALQFAYSNEYCLAES
jgi:hypothetical protein